MMSCYKIIIQCTIKGNNTMHKQIFKIARRVRVHMSRQQLAFGRNKDKCDKLSKKATKYSPESEQLLLGSFTIWLRLIVKQYSGFGII